MNIYIYNTAADAILYRHNKGINLEDTVCCANFINEHLAAGKFVRAVDHGREVIHTPDGRPLVYHCIVR
jgi:hypothetical protein